MNSEGFYTAEDKREEKAFARESLIYNVSEDLLVIMEQLKVSKAELAKKMGKSKAHISQLLSGNRNLTIGTLSDICFELGLEAKVEFPGFDLKNPEYQQPVKWQLEQALTEDDTLYWGDINPVDIVGWIEQNRKKVLDYLEAIGG